MASKDISNKGPSRVPETKIVGPSRFRKPLEDLVATPSGRFSSPYAAVVTISADGTTGTGTPKPIVKNPSGELVEDVPSLSDIESIAYEEYKNNEGVTKIKVKIKMRNSSLSKANVKGVDARIPPVGE